MDFKDVANRAFNIYLKTVRKSDDYDEAESNFGDEVTDALEADGVDVEWGWSDDMNEEDFKSFILEIISKPEMSDEEDPVIGALWTFIHNTVEEHEAGFEESAPDFYSKVFAS